MRKNLAALFMAGASTAAFAQEEDSITLYGRVFLTLSAAEAPGGKTPVLPRAVLNHEGTALGVRVTETLGDELKGFLQLETSFRPDSSNGPFADRNSAAGLRGAWGTLLMGRWDMPFRAATIAVDAYGDLTPSSITGVLNLRGVFNLRAQNVVQYWSPNVGGFVLRVANAEAENRTPEMDPRVQGASVTFTQGALFAFAAWEVHQNRAVSDRKQQALGVGAYYAFGALRVGGQYQEIEQSGLSDIRAWMGNVIYSLGRQRFIAQYMQSKGGSAPATLQPDCNSWSLGYQYYFSGDTHFVASYIRVKNNDAGLCNFGGNPIAIDPGQDPRAFFVGLAHYF